jgi:cysteine desulfurase
MTRMIYLDNNATTALDERVLDAMLPVLRHVGNAASGHEPGRWARAAIEHARAQVAELTTSTTQEVIFTSGATEANNLAIKGVMLFTDTARHATRNHLVACTAEHPAVRDTALSLRDSGFSVSFVSVDQEGRVNLDQLRQLVSDRTLLVTIMAANNETGVLAPLAQIAEIAHEVGALFHTDATQLMAWGPLNSEKLGIDLLSLSSHKMHGPQGVGALIVRRAVQSRLGPILHGGGHERGLRSGTANTAGIVGFGTAASLAAVDGATAAPEVRCRRDKLEGLLRLTVGSESVVRNGHQELRAPGTLNVSFLGLDAEAVLSATPQVAMTTGSACSTGIPGPSHVLKAMGLSEERCEGAVRLSLSRDTTDLDVRDAAAAIGRGARMVQERMSMADAG